MCVPRPALLTGSSTLFSSLRESATQNVFGHFTSVYFIFADSSITDEILTFCVALLMETPGTQAAIRCTESLVPNVLSTKPESISYNIPITKWLIYLGNIQKFSVCQPLCGPLGYNADR